MEDIGWISAQLCEVKDVIDNVVTTLTPNRQPKDVLLTSEIWMSSLLRGLWKKDFQE